MRTEYLEYLIAVADTGSISATAETLHISQPSLSIAISKIEQEYNIQIFYRTPSGVTLTESGKRFLQQVRTIVNSLQSLKQASDSSKLVGTLKIAAVPGIVNSILPSSIASFHSLHPLLTIDVEENGSFAVKHAVDENLISVGLCSTRDFQALDAANYLYYNLFQGHVMACLSPSHVLAHKTEVSLRDLSGHSLVIFNRSFRMYTHIISMLNEIDKPNVILTTSNYQLAREVIIATNAVGFFSNVLITNDSYIQENKLISLPILEEEPTTFVTLQKRSQANDPIAKAFVSEIRRQATLFINKNQYGKP